jgi:sialic acid synthase SpsE
MAEEMRINREIKSAEKDHKQNLERAREVSDLAQELAASFVKDNSLDREDIKKLEKLEKLAKRIRSEAGGSEDEVIIEKRPSDLVEAMNCIAKVSASLNEKVQETPRQVVSATIIDKANVLLELIRIVRSLSGKV